MLGDDQRSEPDAPSFGEQLRRHRLAAGLTQEELAERAGVSLRGLSDLERGKRRIPYPDTARRLADALELGELARAKLERSRDRHVLASVEVQRPLQTRGQLPAAVNSFVGRQAELAELEALLHNTRLVTLVGPGGVGKTRLAIETARRAVAEYADGTWLVELASLADGRLVPQALAAVLGVREQAGRPILATLEEALSNRALLLVLDNCEHLVDACAALASTLLRSCADVCILATSREPLGVPGETTWLVPSLSVPERGEHLTLAQLERSDSAQLFIDRARAAWRDFALSDAQAAALAEICRRLDGLPLALELAAARVRLLSLEQLANRLEHHFIQMSPGSRIAPARHQTLQATVDWSYALLSDPERQLFEQLSVFAGGWTLEAMQAVCSVTDGTSPDVVDLLARLVDRSLVVTDSSGTVRRYRLLEMLRQHAAERLRSRGAQPATRRHHTHYFVGLLDRAEKALTTSAQGGWLDILEQEHDNVRAAMRWSIESGEIQQGLRIGWVMWRFWWVRGYLTEGRQRLAELLELARPAGPSAFQARGLVSAGLLAMWQADYAAATAHLEEALAMARRFHDSRAAAYALACLNRVRRDQGDEAEARRVGDEAVAILRQLDDPWGLALALHFLGLAIESIDLAMARRHFDESLSLFRKLGNTWDPAMPLRGLGDVASLEGDAAAAERLYEQSIELFGQRGDNWSVAMLRTQQGFAVLAQHATDRAAELFARSLSSWRALGHRRGAVLCLAGFASIAADRKHFVEAARLLAAAQSAAELYAVALEPTAQAIFDTCLGRMRRQLESAVFESAWSTGGTLGLDDALETALTMMQRHGSNRKESDGLTAREREVAHHISLGLTNRQIGERLVVSERTVDRHVENILKKLGRSSRTQIAAWAATEMRLNNAPSLG